MNNFNNNESNINLQANNVNYNNNINSKQINPLSNNNLSQYDSTPTNQLEENELLKSFIGNNYDKITKRQFNFAGFFFTTFYMFYRKMFGYTLLVFLLNFIVLNIIDNIIITILFNILVGLFVNKIYLFYANKKIAKIKNANQHKNIEELKKLCSIKGRASVGSIFLGFITELVITVVILIVMMMFGINGNMNEILNIIKHNISNPKILVEDVIIDSNVCFESKCYVTIDKENITTDYVLILKENELITKLDNYSDYVKVNIYYTEHKKEKTIVDYKVFLKSNNEDISNIKTENELRKKIGLYGIGVYTDSFTLSKIGMFGVGIKGDTQYTYINYTFIDDQNIEYEMKYINGGEKLIEGNKYKVTFEVVESPFNYEFNIKSVE